MTTKDRRKHPRTKTDYPISYDCMDDNGNLIEEGMGTVVNISQGGVLIETLHPIESKDILLSFINIKDELISIRGKVVYCKAVDSGMSQNGIQFLETKEKIISFVKNLIKAYTNI